MPVFNPDNPKEHTMHFTPKSEDQIARENCREPGEYDFTVSEALDAVSKTSGKDMIKVSLQVFDKDGETFLMTDYLMESMAYKLRHFAYSVGLGPAYESGALETSSIQGRSGRVKIIIKEDKTGQYKPKNEVKDYIVGESTAVEQVPEYKPAPRVPIGGGAGNDDNSPPF